MPAAERAAEFTPILQKIVDPLLQSCVLSATVKQLDLSSMAVYMINCISSLMVLFLLLFHSLKRILKNINSFINFNCAGYFGTTRLHNISY